MRNTGDNSGKNAAISRAGSRIVQTPKTERIQNRNGPRAHREDVAENATHSGRRALKRFDKTGMIVRFNLESDDVSAADIDDARIFSRALHNELSPRRKLLQVNAGAFVRAVFAPHHAEDA